MVKNVDVLKAGELATNYFDNGYHCAEAVVAACLETVGENAAEAIAHATPFGGGLGKTFAEACGALSGGMIVIGHLHGRRQQGENWDLAARLGAALRQQFIVRHGNTNCGILRDRFGAGQQLVECRKLVEETTVALMLLLEENRQEENCQTNCCPSGHGKD